MATPCALILDDEPELTFLLSSILEFNQFMVRVTNRPDEALTLLKDQAYDILITDYMMGLGAINGIEVIRQVRQVFNQQAIKIVMLTFKDLTDEELGFLSREHVVYLRKPFLPNELISKIEALFA